MSAAAGSLPPLYAVWMGQLLGAPVPGEPKATCLECAMAPGRGQAPDDAHPFHPDAKCCTYYPELANFLVGVILEDRGGDMRHARAVLKKRFADAVGVTPLGVARPAVFWQLYQAKGRDVFGRTPGFRCGYYVEETGLCGIWRHRESICTTWFCKHERGQAGQRFWTALQRLLLSLEYGLARHCLLALDIGAAAIERNVAAARDGRQLSISDLAGRADPAEVRALWGSWHGREIDYFLRCARLVAPMSWAEVAAACGSEARVNAELVRAAFADLARPVPASGLVVGRSMVERVEGGRVRLRTYSTFDPVDLPDAVMSALARFDGRPTADVAAELRAQGVALDDAELQRLVDYQILVPRPAT
jgi:hypothetical protein